VHISAWSAPKFHIPLHNFVDRELIAEQLKKLPGVKVIVEGIPFDDFKRPNSEELLRKEVEFVKQFVS
jgi:hypothetical protein